MRAKNNFKKYFTLFLFWGVTGVLSGIFAEVAEVQAGSISGKITSNGTEGIAGVYAQAFKEGVHQANSAKTTGSGEYTINNLEDGESYRVHFFAFDTEYVSRWYSESGPNGAEEDDATPLMVSGEVTDKDIILPLGGTISGQLVKDKQCYSGTIENIWILALNSIEVFRGITKTSETGEFTIGGLPLDEEMKLYIWDYDGAGVEEWYEDAADFAGAKLIAVPSTGITVSFCSLQVNMVPIYKLLLL